MARPSSPPGSNVTNVVGASLGRFEQPELRSTSGPNVSKSDRLLFGEYAAVVRHLGVAVDAASEARRALLDSCIPAPRVGPVVGEEDGSSLLELLASLEGHARRVHQSCALQALTDMMTLTTPQDSGEPIISDRAGMITTPLARPLAPRVALRDVPLTVESLREAFAEAHEAGLTPTELYAAANVPIDSHVIGDSVVVPGGPALAVVIATDLPPDAWQLR